MMKIICGLTAVLAGAAFAFAGGTCHWTHTSEADFSSGTFNNVVADSLGELRLARAVNMLLEQAPRIAAVYCLAEAPDGTVYAGTGPNGIVLAIRGEKVQTFATVEDRNVFSIMVDREGRILMGTGGTRGRVLRMAGGGKPVEVFSAEGVQYIWQMRQTPDGRLYLATGPAGQIFEIAPDGTSSVLFDSEENNILSLVSDGKDLLYAGTDPNGLVYRINRRTKEVFVALDAAESEITALALDAAGNLYAATGQAPEGEEPHETQPATEKSGRPEGTEGTVPLPSPRRPPPKPPAPAPPAAEPDAIPRKMAIAPAAADPAPDAADDDGGEPPLPVPPPGTGPATIRGAVRPPLQPPGARPQPGKAPAALAGNAVYRIDPRGFVTELFRQQAMMLSMIEKDGSLIIGTGSEGLIYEVNTATAEARMLARLDAKQVMAVLPARDGRMILALANAGGLAAMSGGYAAKGTYLSPVLDAGQISRFGKIRLQGSLPAGTGLTVAVRSGNLQEPDDRLWSKWSQEHAAAEFLAIDGTPAARFFQYRLTFTSTDGRTSPVVDEVDVAYQVPNMAPQVKAVRIAGDAGDAEAAGAPPAGAAQGVNAPRPLPAPAGPHREGPPPYMRTITWEASDPNGDALEYTLFFQAANRGPWVLLAEKLKEPQFQWDTRGVADGRYRIKVVASDARANPRGEGLTASRLSDPTVVDNTPPVIGDIRSVVAGNSVRIEAKLTDRTGIAASCEYAVDSKDDWQAVPPADNIWDSPEETVAFTIDGLAPGPHQITLRASDDRGNHGYETIHVTIAGPAAK